MHAALRESVMIQIIVQHTMINEVLCHLVNRLSSSRGVIDLFDWEQFPVKRGGYKQTVISEEQTAKARDSASEDGARVK
jgi:hypothetical protein